MMDLSTLGPLAASLTRAGLPALGTILGAVVPPPYDLMVKPAFAAISWAMGVDPAASDASEQVQAKVDADPAGAQQQLQHIEDTHADAAAELQAYLADVQNARSTQVEYIKANSLQQWVAPIWTGMIAGGFIAMLFILVLHSVDFTANQATALNILFGVLTAEFGRCGAFWLGTTQSAGKRVDQALNFAANVTPPRIAPKAAVRK